MNDNQFRDEMRALGINTDEVDVVNLGGDMEGDLVVDNTSNSAKNIVKRGIGSLIGIGIFLFISIVTVVIVASYRITFVNVQGTSFNVGPAHFVPKEYTTIVDNLKPGVQVVYAEGRNGFIGPFLKTYKIVTIERKKNDFSYYVSGTGSKDLEMINKSDIIYIVNSVNTQKALENNE